jgi:CBS domain containing-hemolysin-like protein
MNDPAQPRIAPRAEASEDESSGFSVIRNWLRWRKRHRKPETALRDAIEELIEEAESDTEAEPARSDEGSLLLNILKLRDLAAEDIMVPRADVIAAPLDIALADLVRLMIAQGHSRLPIYRETLDDTVGMVHVKDVLACLAGDRRFDLMAIRRELLFIAPSMPVLDLLLEMRMKRVHMALVVDEFGGIDGLVTIEDVVEEIVGEIDDEHDVAEGPRLVARPDGTLLADARATLEEFEEKVGRVLTEEERREDVDTLAGLVVAIAGRVPARGELITHASGIAFEVLDADPRRIKRLKIHNLPPRSDAA